MEKWQSSPLYMRIGALALSLAILFSLIAALLALFSELYLTTQKSPAQEGQLGYNPLARATLNITSVEDHAAYGNIVRGDVSISNLPSSFFNEDGKLKQDLVLQSNSFINPKHILPAGSLYIPAVDVFLKAKESKFGRYLTSAEVEGDIKLYALEGGAKELLPLNIMLNYSPGDLELNITSNVDQFMGKVYLKMSLPFTVITSLFLAVISTWFLSVYNGAFIAFAIKRDRSFSLFHYVYAAISPALFFLMLKLPSYNPYNVGIFDDLTISFCLFSSAAALCTLVSADVVQATLRSKIFNRIRLAFALKRSVNRDSKEQGKK